MKKFFGKKFFVNTFLVIITIMTSFLVSIPVATAPPPLFKLVAEEGQGIGTDEFYEGRCFQIDIRLNTNSLNTNGADVEINYDNSVLRVVDSDCTTSATDIITDGLFDVYPSVSNSVTASKILLSAYNNPGNSTNVSDGLFGHFFVEVLDDPGSHSITFEYTQDLTTDTNLAETNGNGSDILASIENLTLDLLTDTDDPTITNKDPDSGDTDVDISSNITFNLEDAQSGIDSSSASARMRKVGDPYIAQTLVVSNEQSTNENRYYQYDGLVTPDSNIKTNSGFYEYASTYEIEVTVSDLGDPTTHTTIETWTFTTEDDTDAPYVNSQVPASGATSIDIDTNIVFRVNDYKNNDGSTPGLGVDTSSIAVSVSSTSFGTVNYTCASVGVTCDATNPSSILVTIDPATDFVEDETVQVEVEAQDLHTTPNVMSKVTYTFTTADTVGPTVDTFSPEQYSIGNDVDTNISFHVKDSSSGVDLSELKVYINNVLYTAGSPEMTVNGDSSDYEIIIDPATDFVDNRAVVVRIEAQDQATIPNRTSPDPIEYTFVVGLDDTGGSTVIIERGGGSGYFGIERECPVCEICAPPEKVQVIVEVPVPFEVPAPQTSPPPVIVNPDSNSSSGGSCLIVEEAPQREFVDLSRPIETGGGDIVQTTSPFPVDITNKVKTVRLETINNQRLLSHEQVVSVDPDSEFIRFIGKATAPEKSVIPILFYHDTLGGKDPIFALQGIMNDRGFWQVFVKNTLPRGTYRITSLVQSADGKQLVEKQIGVMHLRQMEFVDEIKEEEAKSGLFIIKQREKLTPKFSTMLGFVFAIIIIGALAALIFGQFELRIFNSLLKKHQDYSAKKLDSFMKKAYFRYYVQSALIILAVVVSVVGLIMLFTFSDDDVTVNSSRNQSNEIVQAQDDIERLVQFRGRLLEAKTSEPITDVRVLYNGELVEVSSDGSFSLFNVLSTDEITLEGGRLLSKQIIKVGPVADRTINLDTGLLAFFTNFEPLVSQHKYRKVYPYLHNPQKLQLSEEQFLRQKNDAFIDKITNFAITKEKFDIEVRLLESWKSELTGAKYNNVLQANYVYTMVGRDNQVKTIVEPWHFINTSDGWQFVL